jgi:aspartyl-tRNA(Asn)/glutamyl-tRNA(Gln) amidotransferase subunit C
VKEGTGLKINEETVDYTANLSKLNLTEQEKAKMTSDMADIISYFDKLNELDIKNVKPMEHVMSVRNVLRDDHVRKSFDREKMLANAPSSEDGCFKVPKVVE